MVDVPAIIERKCAWCGETGAQQLDTWAEELWVHDGECNWKFARNRCRTDLRYLCHILGYKDVSLEVHGKMLSHLHQFEKGTEEAKPHLKNLSFKPKYSLYEQPGPRKRLMLVYRGALKSTISTIAHKVQWIVNYPDVRIHLSGGVGPKVQDFLRAILEHFRINETFRALFPEYVPHMKNNMDFGNQEGFTCPARRIAGIKEPTVSISAVGSVVASSHYDVIDIDDAVDKENSRTAEQVERVSQHIGMLWPLLQSVDVGPYRNGWFSITGTLYDHSDAHSRILRAEEERKQDKLPPEYKVLVQSAAPNYPEGPLAWPNRVNLDYLKAIEDDPNQGPGVLYPQYLMRPIVGKSGLIDSPDQVVWIPPKYINELYDSLIKHVTIDLAGMEVGALADNDYTVVNLHGFGHDGTLYVLKVWRGRYTPFELIDILFQLAKDHPRVFDFKIEKEAHARVLLPFLKREMVKRQKWLPMVEIKRDNLVSKKQRIKGLQPWFRNGSVKFASDIPCRLAILDEIQYFDKYPHDDFLDTLADAMQNCDGGVTSDILPRARVLDAADPAPPGARTLQMTDLGWEEKLENIAHEVNELTGW